MRATILTAVLTCTFALFAAAAPIQPTIEARQTNCRTQDNEGITNL